MANNDREHFETYREQTRVKHAILEKYLFAYFNTLKGNHKNLAYIDGFAGRGTYTLGTERIEGSPLRALKKVLSLKDLADRVSFLFIEQDPVLATELDQVVGQFHTANPSLKKPLVYQGAFTDGLKACLDYIEQRGGKLAPTFLFVDPCGVAGASFEAIERVMKNEWCEIFLFFNIDGVRRILGLGDRMGDTLNELLGSAERTQDLLRRFNACSTAAQREDTIVDYYATLLRERTPAKYITAFKVEKEDKRATSHYLIHATRHPLGFAIMKDVMWGEGKSADGSGGLTFAQASTSNAAYLFKPEWEAVKQSILAELAISKRQVSYFYTDMVIRPDNRLCERAYRAALLELESEGAIVVLNKSGFGIAPPRRTIKGKLTLAKDYYVMKKGGPG